MRRVVVDASVVIAGLFKDGTVRDSLLAAENVAYLAPSYLTSEVVRHLSDVSKRAKIPLPVVRTVLEDLLEAIELVPPGVYSKWMDVARRLARAAGALGDADYIALAFALEAPVWTLDKDFRRNRGLRVVSTSDLPKYTAAP